MRGVSIRSLGPLCIPFVFAMLISGASAANAQHAHVHHEEEAPREVTESLGAVSFPISCSAEAQRDFERAVAFLHHMMYVEARSSFKTLTAQHPDCAMAHWGYAMTLFQPLWPTRPSPEALTEGWEAIRTAKTIGPGDNREEAFVAAAEAFFKDPTSADYWTRIKRFEVASEKVHKAFPGGSRGQQPSTPSLIWQPRLRAETPSDHNDKAAEILLAIHRDAPTHPGAIPLHHHTPMTSTAALNQSLDVVRSYGGDRSQRPPRSAHADAHLLFGSESGTTSSRGMSAPLQRR